jgi:hypothetical protein
MYWMRPEDMGTMERPAFYVDPSMPGTDVIAAASAALAAASMAFSPLNREYAGALLKESQALYTFAAGYLGSYSKWVPTEGTHYSESYYDDLAWAAAWIYKASGSGQYLKEAENWWGACAMPLLTWCTPWCCRLGCYRGKGHQRAPVQAVHVHVHCTASGPCGHASDTCFWPGTQP